MVPFLSVSEDGTCFWEGLYQADIQSNCNFSTSIFFAIDSPTLIALKHLTAVSSRWPRGPLVTVGNETLIHLDFDFANGQYVEAYDTLMRSGQYRGSRSMLVDYKDFGNGNTIFALDLTARGECNSEQFTLRKLKNVRINLKYSNALTETNNLILYGEFDGVLPIDANKNVVTDYL